MAKFNPTLLGSSLFGKVGGQSALLTRNGSVLKTNTIPNLNPTPKQAKQRFLTAGFSNAYMQLSAGDKTSWETTASNYTYVNSAGDTITRNGFESFSFVAQNLEILGLPLLETAPTYAAITQPNITIETSSVDEFVIKGTSLVNTYTYVVFSQIHRSVGAISLQSVPIIVGSVSYAELLAGIDVVPLFELNQNIPDEIYSSSIKVVAIDFNTGNRDLDGVYLNTLIDPNPAIPAITYSSFINVGNRPINQGSFNADGSSIFNSFHTGGRDIKRYDLSTPYDLSTAVFHSSKTVTPSSPRGSVITPDGLNIYTFNSSGNRLYQGVFTTPFDFTTYSHVRTAVINSRNCQFNSDGTKMISFLSSSCAYYTLTTPYDVSTLVFQSSKSYGFSGGAFFGSPDGSQFFVMRSNRRLYTFNMSTPFDVSTAVLQAGNLYFGAIIGSYNFSGMTFSYDGYYVLWSQYNDNPRFKMFALTVPFTFPASF